MAPGATVQIGSAGNLAAPNDDGMTIDDSPHHRFNGREGIFPTAVVERLCSHLRFRIIRVGVGILATASCVPAWSAVTHFDILYCSSIAAESSNRFKATDIAEQFVAHAVLELDPADSRNAVIVDLDRAPRNARGKIDFEADVVIVRPAKPSGLMLVEFPNRGGSQIFNLLNDIERRTGSEFAEGGNGFLLAKGYTLVVVGWQGDIRSGGKIGTTLPIAKNVSGFSRDEWVLPKAEEKLVLPLSWPVKNPATAQLLERSSEDGPSTQVASSRWHLVGENHLEISSLVPRTSRVIYELRYIAKDSAVMGMGFTAVRDIALFLEHDAGPSNPLAADGHSIITHSILTGVSQSGRAVRDFLYLGFNSDADGKRVFDGMLPIIPGSRRTFTNARFAQPSRNPGPEADQQYPADQFPFAYDVQKDSQSGRVDGILLRCRSTKTCPKIMEFDSEYEFWGARASLVVTDTRGNAVALPDEVRAYMLAGSPHSNPWNAVSTRNPNCVLPSSPVAAGPIVRALLVALDVWITDGTLPPKSYYPSVAEGTLVQIDDVYPEGLPLPFKGQHLRAQWIEQTESGPVIKGEYPVLLPKADRDGNAIAGVHLPQVAAPRATYVGWNPQIGAIGTQALCDHAAGMIPFAHTKSERTTTNDARLSIEERYDSREQYHSAVVRAAEQLVSERLLLKEDVDIVVGDADVIE